MASRNERCTFCGRGYDSDIMLVAGPPDVYMCNECVDLCSSILQQERVREARLRGEDGPGGSAEDGRTGFAEMERLWAEIAPSFRASLLSAARAAACWASREEKQPERDA